MVIERFRAKIKMSAILDSATVLKSGKFQQQNFNSILSEVSKMESLGKIG
jgi:hypothetical protein